MNKHKEEAMKIHADCNAMFEHITDEMFSEEQGNQYDLLIDTMNFHCDRKNEPQALNALIEIREFLLNEFFIVLGDTIIPKNQVEVMTKQCFDAQLDGQFSELQPGLAYLKKIISAQ